MSQSINDYSRRLQDYLVAACLTPRNIQLAIATLPRAEYTRNAVDFTARICMFVLAAQPASTDTRPKVNPVRRILGRIGSQLHPIRRSSGHERDVRQVIAWVADRERGFKDSLTAWALQ